MVPGAQPEGLVGRRLGEYVVREALAAGGQGQVYLAEQPGLERDVVIKVVRARGSAERLADEARVATRLDHPFAAHVYGTGREDDGLVWVAMEHVRGVPLDRLLAVRGPLSLAALVPFIDRLCEVVHTAHELGIVHRDIKPQNVMVLRRAGRMLPKLLDLGIASVLQRGTDRTGGLELIGSPLYMAPEQWRDPDAVDRRADIYSLGCLIYEALTGEPPFEGDSLEDLAEAHLLDPAPPLDGRCPVAVNAVVARALAKEPEQRFSTALELAAALREAAGLRSATESIPPLPPELITQLIAGMPQPIAETVAAFEAAPSVAEAREASRLLARTLVAFIAQLALACRSRGEMGVEAGLGDLLRELSRRSLDAENWLEVARRAADPWKENSELCPIPELPELLDPDAGELPALIEQMGRDPGLVDPAGARIWLRGAVDRLAAALEASGFLAHYSLCAVTDGQCRRWMGTRRPVRATVQLLDANELDGRVLLLSADSLPLVDLTPLLCVAPPMPGGAEEMFMVAGGGGDAVRMVSPPLGFERRDQQIGRWLREQLHDQRVAGSNGEIEERPPYLGLAPFSLEDADRFYGREREVEVAVNRLVSQRLLALVGPSGAGKSSFAFAGIAARLAGEREVVSFRPGHDPIAALERARAALAGDRGLLLVDQLEELFTLCDDADTRGRLARALCNLEGDCRVVITLRDDFLMRAERLPELGPRLSHSLMLLGPPRAEELERCLVEPARRVGYRFESPELVAGMVAEVAGNPSALPLLSFAAAQLWQRRDRHFRRLTRTAYELLGGVGGALAGHADATLAELPAAERPLVRRAFGLLVTDEGTRAVVPRDDLLAALGGDHRAKHVVDALIDARLLRAYEGSDGRAQLEVAHEALLDQWPQLKSWRRQDAEGAQFRRQLRAAAEQWHKRDRPRGMLWRGDALAEYQLWHKRHQPVLTELEGEFAGASLRDARTGRRFRQAAIGVAFIGITAALLVALHLNRRTEAAREQAIRSEELAKESADAAQRRLAQMYLEAGRNAWLDRDPLAAATYLAQASREGADAPAIEVMASLLWRQLPHAPALRHETPITTAWTSPAGDLLITGTLEGKVYAWDVEARSLRWSKELASGPIFSVAFDARGERVALAIGDDGVAVLASVDGDVVMRMGKGEGTAMRAEISDDGRFIAGILSDRVTRWSPDGQRRTVAVDGALAMDMDTTGAGALIGTRDGSVWWVEFAKERASLVTKHEAPVWRLKLSPDGRTTVSAGQTGHVVIADRHGARPSRRISAHPTSISSLELDRDGSMIITSAQDGSARIFDIATGDRIAVLDGHDDNVTRAGFCGDGKVVTASSDGAAKLWHWRHGTITHSFHGHANTVIGAWCAGDDVVTASMDGTARVHRAGKPWHDVGFDRLPAPPIGLAVGRDGQEIAVLGQDGSLTIWDQERGAIGYQSEPGLGTSLAALAAGDAFAVAGRGWRLVAADGTGLASGAEGEQLVAIAVSPDGGQIATVSKETLSIWSPSGRLLKAVDLEAEPQSVTLVARDLAVIGYADSIESWDTSSSTRLARVDRPHSSGLSALAFAGPGRVATGGLDKTVRIWDASELRQLASMVGHARMIESLSVSTDGNQLLSVARDGQVRIWDARDGTALARLPASMPLSGVAFVSDDAKIVTAGFVQRIDLWWLFPERITAAELRQWADCLGPYDIQGQRLTRRGLTDEPCGH